MTTYRERLVPPVSWWLAGAFFAVVWGWLVLVVAGPTAAVVVALALGVVIALALWTYGGSIVIAVGPEGLAVGRARLEPRHVGEVQVLDAAAMRRRHGPEADVRAWLMHRAYVSGGAMIFVADPADPTPYWLVSSRHPHRLAAALACPEAPVPTDLPTTDPGGSHGEA
ncbi:DUF3093 domain-containing protein [Aeromicrobium sp. CF4.19]|uniref:DUF3093 domain-containing protein n=1 Tax=Aeromicrobium sp. CF4.19 TaxID=3373082 RepID=UPI003EE746BE